MTVSAKPTQARMFLRLAEISTYVARWKHTLAPSPVAFQDAERFVRSHDVESWPFPHISAAHDGEINFWWDGPGFWIDLGLYGDGTYSLYACLANSPNISVDHAPLSQPLPAEIVDCLEEVTQ